ncbi:outer membrane protein [Moritella sp. Urea-trap-13]|uniref:outer membrane protein n=1 Tax=Moritella sp. Urea-trap-13 TaxID=2058327 RepID=UPI000C3390C4|nr:hypothetical protein [Moritella sp. Urea-trap-13]PKH04953.1 hypothetical protein CXF93_19290 [Moritella sp. Urea-trap-13]
MKKILLLSALLVSNVANAGLNLDYRAYNTPVNYNFAEVEVGYKTYESADKDIDTVFISIGSELMLSEKVIMKYSFSGEEINDATTVLAANAGLLYRVPLTEKFDLVLGGELEFDWVGVEESSRSAHYSHENTAIGAHFGLRYGFTDKLEAVTQVVISDSSSDSLMTTISTTKLSYYLTENVGVGAFYSARFNDDLDTSNVGAHVRFRF